MLSYVSKATNSTFVWRLYHRMWITLLIFLLLSTYSWSKTLNPLQSMLLLLWSKYRYLMLPLHSVSGPLKICCNRNWIAWLTWQGQKHYCEQSALMIKLLLTLESKVFAHQGNWAELNCCFLSARQNKADRLKLLLLLVCFVNLFSHLTKLQDTSSISLSQPLCLCMCVSLVN